MTLDDVAELVGVSKRTIMRWVALGRFPPPLIHAGRVVTWRDRIVLRWCKEKPHGRNHRRIARK